MALNRFAVNVLRQALGDRAAGDEITTLLNTHLSGTLSVRTKRIIKHAYGSRADGTAFITAAEASSALSATNLAKLGQTLGSSKVAALIAAELIA